MRKPDSERQIWYVVIHKWLLDIKQRINIPQSTAPKKLGNKEDPKRDMWIVLGRGIK